MPVSSPPAWQRTAGAFTAAVESGRLDLPLPGSGATWERWAAFADLAGEDLSLARLGEGHADAIAILAELGGPARGVAVPERQLARLAGRGRDQHAIRRNVFDPPRAGAEHDHVADP